MSGLIGILGGTFDPVHYGHLKPADEIRRRLSLDELRLLPCRHPVHRPAPVAGPEQRLTLLRLALEEFPQFILDDRELRRDEASYSVITLNEIRRESPRATLCLLMGLDALQSFRRWYRWREILGLAHLVVSHRPGYTLAADSEAARLLNEFGLDSVEALRERSAGGILLLETGDYDISATGLRERLRRGGSVTGLLPAAVADWLNKHPIYTDEANTESICS